jgi:hypothetical protein
MSDTKGRGDASIHARTHMFAWGGQQPIELDVVDHLDSDQHFRILAGAVEVEALVRHLIEAAADSVNRAESVVLTEEGPSDSARLFSQRYERPADADICPMTRSSMRGRRRPLTKAMLLPLATDHVRNLQLKHHLALAALRDGHGGIELLGTLLNVLYLAYHLRDIAGDAEVGFYRGVEVILQAYTARAISDNWTLLDAERGMLEQLLVVHDAQLAAAPMHRYVDAWNKVNHLVQMAGRSPIPMFAAT